MFGRYVYTPVPVSGLKSVLDFLEKGEGYPSPALLVCHAEIRQPVIYSIVEHVPGQTTAAATPGGGGYQREDIVIKTRLHGWLCVLSQHAISKPFAVVSVQLHAEPKSDTTVSTHIKHCTATKTTSLPTSYTRNTNTNAITNTNTNTQTRTHQHPPRHTYTLKVVPFADV